MASVDLVHLLGELPDGIAIGQDARREPGSDALEAARQVGRLVGQQAHLPVDLVGARVIAPERAKWPNRSKRLRVQRAAHVRAVSVCARIRPRIILARAHVRARTRKEHRWQHSRRQSSASACATAALKRGAYAHERGQIWTHHVRTTSCAS